ncbi:MAG TPA: hypothetical protein VMT71_04225 [Syntrophorhabdales bacterium]|nr:hypothetical protein [Syntrophorhabdales bacterium]
MNAVDTDKPSLFAARLTGDDMFGVAAHHAEVKMFRRLAVAGGTKLTDSTRPHEA